jgi:hypothetical protein
VFFPSGWARYADARPGSLRLVSVRKRTQNLASDYDSMQEMFFGERIAFTECCASSGGGKPDSTEEREARPTGVLGNLRDP